MHARAPAIGADTYSRCESTKVSTKLHDVTVRTVEGGAGSLNNASIMHVDKRAVCCVFPFSPALLHLGTTRINTRVADARQRTRARKYIPRRVSDTRHARFSSSRERNDTLSTYIRSDSPQSPNFYWPTPRKFYRGDIFPNRYDFQRGEK